MTGYLRVYMCECTYYVPVCMCVLWVAMNVPDINLYFCKCYFITIRMDIISYDLIFSHMCPLKTMSMIGVDNVKQRKEEKIYVPCHPFLLSICCYSLSPNL